MSTWHQKFHMPLWHATLWTVVDDPLNGALTVTRFATYDEARRYASASGGYVLSPHPAQAA